MTDYASFQSRLEAVEAKRKEVESEFDEVRAEALQHCLELCRTFKFTAKELQLTAPATTVKSRGTAKPKFQNPNGEETWSGRGAVKPKWFVDALAEGYTKEDMLIK